MKFPDDGIGLRPVPKSEDPQWQEDRKYYCLNCGCRPSNHVDGLECEDHEDCIEYVEDYNNPILPDEPDWDTMPGGHDDY